MTELLDPRIYEQFNSRAPFKLEDAMVLLFARAGSHSHNTYTPKDDPNAIDDTDFMGVIVPPIEFTLGMRNWDNVDFIFEELDCVFYSFRKFVGLLSKGNPNVLGLLFLDPSSVLIKHKAWDDIISNRTAFENKGLTFNSFVGYARNQFKRMTRFSLDVSQQWDESVELITAAGWDVAEVTGKKSRGMPDEIAVGKILKNRYPDSLYSVRSFINVQLETAVGLIQLIHARHFQGYMGERRKNLVRKFGYDTKNAAHLIRLMRMCNEYLISGKLQVFRTIDAQELKDIKSGKWEFERVQAEAGKLFAEAEELVKVSTLPEEPDMEWINELCVRTLMDVYKLIPASPESYPVKWRNG